MAAALLLSVSVVVFLLGPLAGPAHACLCSEPTDGQAFRAADAVFKGRVTDIGTSTPKPPKNGSFPPLGYNAWTFAVSEVYKGDITASQKVLSGGTSCAMELPLPHDREFFIFATLDVEGDGDYFSMLCEGNRLVGDVPLAVGPLQSIGRAPRPTPPDRVDASGGNVALLVGVGTAGVLALALAGLGWRARARRRQGEPA